MNQKQPVMASEMLAMTPEVFEAVQRVIQAAKKFLESETEVARYSFSALHAEREDEFDDRIWLEEDPQGAPLAIELREALRFFA